MNDTALVDLTTWAIRDAVRIDANLSDLPDPYATLTTLGYGNPVEVRKLLNMADLELEHPQSYPRPGDLLPDAYRILFSGITDAFVAACPGKRADQVAAALVGGGLVVAVSGILTASLTVVSDPDRLFASTIGPRKPPMSGAPARRGRQRSR